MKVFFTAEANEDVVSKLREHFDIEFDGWNIGGDVFSEEELIQKLEDVDIFVTSYDKVTSKVIESSKNLKLIGCTRSNPVNINLDACKRNGVQVFNTPGRNSDVTAEFAVGMLLNISRNITLANRHIVDGAVIQDETPTEMKKDVTWGLVKNNRPYNMFKGPQIKNKNVGIIGYGSIGKRVADIMTGFGANILVYDPYKNRLDVENPSTKLVDLEELIEKSDYISCHTKITPETEGLFNKETFKKMKNNAFLINNSRGAIINEGDLHEALKNGEIAGAALDVFGYEPLYKEHLFIKEPLDNLLLTPHISGASDDSIINGTKLLVDELINYKKNGNLLFKVV